MQILAVTGEREVVEELLDVGLRGVRRRVVAVIHASLRARGQLKGVWQRHRRDRVAIMRKALGQPPLAIGSSGPNCASRMKSIALRTGFLNRSSPFSRYIRSLNCDATAVPRIIERGAAVTVPEFFQPPAVTPDGVVPVLERPLALKIVDVVPAALGSPGLLHGHRGTKRRLVEALVAIRVIGVQIDMPHRRRCPAAGSSTWSGSLAFRRISARGQAKPIRRAASERNDLVHKDRCLLKGGGQPTALALRPNCSLPSPIEASAMTPWKGRSLCVSRKFLLRNCSKEIANRAAV